MNNQMCVQTVYWVLDLLSYGMSCDDNNFCGSLPDKACCTRHQPLTFGKNMIVKCNGGENFEEATMDFNSFPDVRMSWSAKKGDCKGMSSSLAEMAASTKVGPKKKMRARDITMVSTLAYCRESRANKSLYQNQNMTKRRVDDIVIWRESLTIG
ncbi:hypothetical protein TL16_g13113 [Triparma laevis f. inornata]|uniref:Uncharacterized protein n=1 Tax=Triparma laevis f. inornata TaxID=1714386 RepID=A0A9W7BRG8_9STRA|nr:hypothetical protein TL16_g13113 [Triparma laevis f. inornata]